MEKHPPTAPGLAQVPPGTPTETPEGRGFIGSKSDEFALSKKGSHQPEQPRQEVKKTITGGDDAGAVCNVCTSEIKEEDNFCSSCGADQNSKQIVKALNIDLTEEDLSEYLFKGYLAKEIPIVGDRKAVFKTLLPSETEQIEMGIVKKFGDDQVSNSLWQNTYAVLTLSHGWIKFDGTSLGKDPDDRLKRLQESIGGHLIDIAHRKWNIFNRAISAMLEDPDIIKN